MNKEKFIESVASKNYTGPSIVDYLNMSGVDSSPASRSKMAADRGIAYNTGANNAAENTALLNALRAENMAGQSTSDPNVPVKSDTATPAIDETLNNPDLAFTRYIQALSETDEEKMARKYVADLVSNAKRERELAASSGETLGYAQGQEARTNKYNSDRISSAKDAYDMLKAGRENSMKVAELKYNYAKDKAAKKTPATKEFTLAAGQKRYVFDEKTNTYKVVGEAPTKATTATVKNGGGTTKKTSTTERDNEIEQAVQDFEAVRKLKNWAGISVDDYNEQRAYFLSTYGSAAVAALDKAIKNAGLEVDVQGDGKGGW